MELLPVKPAEVLLSYGGPDIGETHGESSQGNPLLVTVERLHPLPLSWLIVTYRLYQETGILGIV